jgi:tetratricopeptide (TPR) repeat protein
MKNSTLPSDYKDASDYKNALRNSRCPKLIVLRSLVGVVLLLAPALVHGQASLWKTYFEAGRKAYDRAEKIEEGSSSAGKENRQLSFAEARKRFELARREAETFGPQDQRLATTLSWLVSAYLKEENYAAAEPFAKQLLVLWRTNPGPQVGTTALTLTRLGNSYYADDKFAEAEQFYDTGLALVEKSAAGSREHRLMLELRYNLAGVYLYTGKVDETVRVLTAIFDPAVKERGEKDEFVARIDARLGIAYERQRKYAEAEASYRRALTLFAQAKELRWAFSVLDNLHGMFRSRGEYASSEKLLKPIVTALESDTGRRQELSRYLVALGLAYQSQEKFAEAARAFERVRDMYKEIRPAGHADQGTIRNNIAKAFYYLRKYAEAEPLYREAIEISKRANGPDNADAAWYEKNYALLLYARGEKERADELFQKAIAKLSSSKGDGQPSVASSLFELGELYRRQERYAEAEPLLKQALEMRQKFMQPDHLDLALTMERYAATLRMLNKQTEALKLEEQALAIRSKHTRPK